MCENANLENKAHFISSSSYLTRRQFLKRLGILGGGIVVYFTGGHDILSARTRRQGFLGANIPTDFNAFLRIGTDERVTCFTGKIEMGQGPITSLPQMLAEELDVSYDVVDIVMGDTDLCPWDAGTWGSLTTRYFGVFLREAASEAKGVLKELAAEHLECPVDRILAKNGVLFDKTRPSRRVTYGHLTKGKVIEKHLKDLPPLKPVSEFSVIGKSYLRQDALEKVTGKAQFAGDIRLPEMAYAKILRPPAHGALLKDIDVSPAKEVKGAHIVRDGEFIAVLHDQPDQAEEAVARIKAQFDVPKTGVDDKTIFDELLRKAPSAAVVAESGSIDSGRKKAATLIEETYLNSYVAHAPMEPHTAVAQFEDNRITMWASTQAPFSVQRTIAGALNMSMEQVRVITPFVGGGFGGKSASQQAVEAARLAEMTGRPVQVAWSREEELHESRWDISFGNNAKRHELHLRYRQCF
ncbi:MAG: xanthine dehydrogenase family protein molybdopterin-binding subunit [Deltaproteobacteria bacterium]|nr:xanthine dehydrogenase family protein molybdopterin-binding subunit [Deltaproteobacteria bacterium]